MCERVDPKQCKIRTCLGHKSLQENTDLKLKFHHCSRIRPYIRIANGVEKYVKEATPVQEEERASGSHPQANGTLFRWDKEDGVTFKYKIPKIHIASKCHNSSRIYYDTKMLDEKKMPKFHKANAIHSAVLVSEQMDRRSGKSWKNKKKFNIA